MTETRRPQRNTKATPAPRRVFLLTDLSDRSGRHLGDTLDERIAATAPGWRLSIRHHPDLSPTTIASIHGDAIIDDGLDDDQWSAAHQSFQQIISLSAGKTPQRESLLIDAYLAGTVAADILLRRGHRNFTSSQNHDTPMMSGFIDEITHAALSASAVQTAPASDLLPDSTILATAPCDQQPMDAAHNVSTLIGIGRNRTDRSLSIGPSVAGLALRLSRWLDDPDRSISSIPPNHVDDDAVAKLPDAFSDSTISAISAYVDDKLSRGKGCKIDEIATDFSLARRTLERRFREVAKTSIHKEITRRQVARARQHLFEPDSTPATAAAASGYSSTRMLSINFRKLTGLSPRSYQSKKIPSKS